MVVENPLSVEQEEALDRDLGEVYSGNVDVKEVNTAESDSYDYRVLADQIQRDRIRSVVALVKWYDDRGEWEVNNKSSGVWKS